MTTENDKQKVSPDKENTKLQEIEQKPRDNIISGEFDEEAVHHTEIQQQDFFSGPIPPPETLTKYKSAGDDIPNRIVTMAEEQQKHRHKLEIESNKAEINAEKRGQNYALIVSSLIIVGSIFLISIGKQIPGVILAGSTLLGLAYIFITGRKEEEQDFKNDD